MLSVTAIAPMIPTRACGYATRARAVYGVQSANPGICNDHTVDLSSKGPKFKCQFAAVRVSSVNSQSEFNTIRKFTSSELMRLLKKEFVQEYY